MPPNNLAGKFSDADIFGFLDCILCFIFLWGADWGKGWVRKRGREEGGRGGAGKGSWVSLSVMRYVCTEAAKLNSIRGTNKYDICTLV
jgi:hypothetical protein